MTTLWPLYAEVNQNNTQDYTVYRCPDPVAVKTGAPWYSYEIFAHAIQISVIKLAEVLHPRPLGVVNNPTPAWDISNMQLSSQIPSANQGT